MTRSLERGAGILLPVSSLPSRFGIGTLGKEAYHFVDELKEAGQKYWQVLPVGPTSFGDSPYQSFSAFAGNPYFIDLETLIEEGLIKEKDVTAYDWGNKEDDISYEAIWNSRYKVLRAAYEKSGHEITAAYQEFVKTQSSWLDDYAIYMACKFYFNNNSWLTWDKDIRFRTVQGMKKYKELLKDEISFWKFIQFKFYEQWDRLKKYANNQNIKLIGDIPIYVALDSCDVWKNPELFALDEERKPVNVAGCPPDAFSDEGQKWGNPLYDWKRMEQDDFRWWRNRMKTSSNLYDIIRIDHFIGIVRYYVIPVEKSARFGWFEDGPGEKLTRAINESIGDAKIIAEDLGVVVDGVKTLLEKAGYPGMKVLEFAFDGNTDNPYLPHMYPKNCVVYGGTHDNETLVGYYKNLPPEMLDYAFKYCDAKDFKEVVYKVIRMAYQSVADVVIFQMQDILEKDNDARMNLPATIGINWRWRLKAGEFTEKQKQILKEFAVTYGRIKKSNKGKDGSKNMLNDIVGKKYGKQLSECSNEEIYIALLEMVKDKASERVDDKGKRKLYYISAEFLIGKLLSNNLINLGLYDQIAKELSENGKDMGAIEEIEAEPSLGNGGLGRLAACFLDSIATLGLNGDGIGLNYHLGLFKQVFEKNSQVETVNPWIQKENWLTKTAHSYEVTFKDFTVKSTLYDIAVTGYENRTNQLHLFDLDSVDENIVKKGIDFDKDEIKKNLTLFLYPDDSDEKGRMLRVYQQYFMVSNAAQYILEECEKKGCKFTDLHEYAAIQINDTHPTMVIPELIRLLVKKGITMDQAIETVSKTCAYTNHTILAEALEKWPLEYLEEVAPSIVPIIKELDKRTRAALKAKKLDKKTIEKIAIIDEDERVHMAHIDIHYGYSVNGVAYLHTEILKENELHDFYELYPEKFNNKTNGITFRRWLIHCNKELSAYIESLIGNGFKKDATELEKLGAFVSDEKVLNEMLAIKKDNKQKLSVYLEANAGVKLDESSIFDIQVKRLHEYKRQQMNALYAIHKYLEIKGGKKPSTPITMVFGAKAAPAYTIAKDIIHMILCLQELINNDKDVAPYFKVVMLENYNVTYAERVIPACDISEQISLASKEASGTGNMKFMLNGAITLGTMDGANVEIEQLVGEDNIYIFGDRSETVIKRYEDESYVSKDYYDKNPAIKEAVDFIVGKQMLKVGDKEKLTRLYKELLNKDWFMTFPDFDSYVEQKEKAYKDYEDRMAWAKKMLVNISKAGFFSSDRTIEEYNKDIWKL